jgi:hypothetical protein
MAVAAAELVLLAAAAVGWLLRATTAGRSPLLYAPLYFVLANVACVVALANVVRGDRIERWTPQRHGSFPERRTAVAADAEPG